MSISVKCKCGKSSMTFNKMKPGQMSDGQYECEQCDRVLNKPEVEDLDKSEVIEAKIKEIEASKVEAAKVVEITKEIKKSLADESKKVAKVRDEIKKEISKAEIKPDSKVIIKKSRKKRY